MTTSPSDLADRFGQALLEIARRSIETGLCEGKPVDVVPSDYPPELRVPCATFVTLRRAGELRGCVGGLEPRFPLVVDVAQSAFRAAFHDYRLPSVTAVEVADLEVHISVLGPLEPLPEESEASLIARLRPGIDGLVLREGERQSTFLPAVWDTLPDPAGFIAELKQKAGLPAAYWSADLRFWRYGVASIP